MKPTKLEATAVILIVLSPAFFVLALMYFDYHATVNAFTSNIPASQPQRAYR